jgi:hypothetical protein
MHYKNIKHEACMPYIYTYNEKQSTRNKKQERALAFIAEMHSVHNAHTSARRRASCSGRLAELYNVG